MIILGGGEFANLIREYDSYYHFSDEASHNTAIECMDILSKLVNDKVNSTKLAYTINEAEKVSDNGFTLFLLFLNF